MSTSTSSTNSSESIVPSLAFVMLYVADLDKATAYLESLGFRYVPEESTPFFREFLDGTGVPFGILLSESGMPKPGTTQIYFKTPDLEALHAQLTAKSIAVTEFMDRPFGRIFDVPDLDGHLLTMQQG